MAERTCLNCVYACCDPGAWLRRLCAGEPLVPICANHPRWPGQLREVPGTPCRNYQPKLPEPDGDVRRIPLGNGRYALVDAADYEWLGRYKWRLHSGYAIRREKRRVIYMHGEIVQPPKGMIVDHVNHNKLDNRPTNLRICTCRENMRNRPKQFGSSSRYKGVGYKQDHKKWYARLMSEGERIWLGYFDDEIEAARAYDFAAVRYFRAFAQLNFPEEWPPQRREEIYEKYPHAPVKAKVVRRKAKHKAAAPRARRPARKTRKRPKPVQARKAKSKTSRGQRTDGRGRRDLDVGSRISSESGPSAAP